MVKKLPEMPWIRKIPQRRAWLPTPVFLPGKSHGQREPGRLQSMGLQSVGHSLATNIHMLSLRANTSHFPSRVSARPSWRWVKLAPRLQWPPV